MKILDNKQDVQVHGAKTVDTFTIKASTKAFSLLSDNLYSNKVGAVVRELSTNAYNAHVMSDKENELFVITLPNIIEPTFKVRDFGPGLTEQEIYNVYTTFFESNSNDIVGCLGLGSKAPFSISDNFTINSYQNGIKTIYSAFLSDTHIPSIAKFGDIPTDEENGLEVEVAVTKENFSIFNKEVKNQLKYFKVKPIVNGNDDFLWELSEEYSYSGTNWKIYKSKEGYSYKRTPNNTAKVVQGQILYDINISAMGSTFDNASKEVKELLECQLLIDVPIGTLTSREALSYDDITTQNIINIVEQIVKELPPKIENDIRMVESEYDARLKFNNIIYTFTPGKYSYNNSLLKLINNTHATWNVKSLVSPQEVADALGLDVSSLVLASSLPKLTYAKGTKKVSKEIIIDYFNNNAYSQKYQWMTKKVDDLNTLTGFYVPSDNTVICCPSGHKIEDFRPFYKGLIELGLLDNNLPIYLLKKKYQSMEHNLVNLFDYAKEKFKSINIKPNYVWDYSDFVDKFINNKNDTQYIIK